LSFLIKEVIFNGVQLQDRKRFAGDGFFDGELEGRRRYGDTCTGKVPFPRTALFTLGQIYY
jgi:hypothetical protein